VIRDRSTCRAGAAAFPRGLVTRELHHYVEKHVAAVLVVTSTTGGAVVLYRNSTGTSDSASQEGTIVFSSQDPDPSDEPLIEGDYEPPVEDPFIEDGEPETYEEFARDAVAGQNPNDMLPVAGGGAITVTERESEPPR